MFKTLWHYNDREIINKCGLDAYFFLRYLKTLLIIFIPICCIVMPILIPINYVGGIGKEVNVDDSTREEEQKNDRPTGLDTLAWGNVSNKNLDRYAAHLLMGILVVIWVCWVFFIELKIYVKVRQDYLTSAEHRLKASATTVLVNSIPAKWLSEEALTGLFDVFPGGIRNIWLNRDLSPLLEKVKERNDIHQQLESAETDLIKSAKKAQLKQTKAAEKKERKERKLKAVTKKERAERDAQLDAEAQQMANSAGGQAAGDKHEVPHSVDQGVRESEHDMDQVEGHHTDKDKSKGFKVLDPFAKVGQGILGVVSKAEKNVDHTLETTNGFMGLQQDEKRAPSRGSDRYRIRPSTDEDELNSPSDTLRVLNQSRNTDRHSGESTSAMNPARHEFGKPGNTVRKINNIDSMGERC